MNTPGGNAVLCAVAAAGAMTTGAAWAHEAGRMTGGGSFFCSDLATGQQRVTHGFELHCKTDEQPSPAEPNNLEINFSGGDNFHLTTLTQALCLDTEALAIITLAGSTIPVLECDQATPLTFGNHQAHRVAGRNS